MAKKKAPNENKPKVNNPNVMGLRAEVLEQPITETLELNYMPYAMSVIVSRAIPEIDGFKPSHRKLLYTMYQMKLLSGPRTKSANVVGQTMKLNPHGDAAIYDTMVRLSRGYGALLHPLVAASTASLLKKPASPQRMLRRSRRHSVHCLKMMLLPQDPREAWRSAVSIGGSMTAKHRSTALQKSIVH